MKARHPAPKGPKKPKFPLKGEAYMGIVAGGLEKMHRKMHGKRGRGR